MNKFDASVGEVAWFSTMMGLGSIVSVLILASIPRLPNAGGWYVVMLIVGAILTAVIWFASSQGLVVLLMFIFGLALGGRDILFRTLVQLQTPPSLVGRVMAIQFVLFAVGALLGALLSAAGSDILRSGGLTLLAVVVLAGVTALVVIRRPALRRMPTNPKAPEENTEPGPG